MVLHVFTCGHGEVSEKGKKGMRERGERKGGQKGNFLYLCRH